MSELVLAPELTAEQMIGAGTVVEGSAPVLITEQEVMFATAAVVLPPPRTVRRRWWASIGRIFATADVDAADADASDERRTPRVYPPRRVDFVEQAAMRREMYRL